MTLVLGPRWSHSARSNPSATTHQVKCDLFTHNRTVVSLTARLKSDYPSTRVDQDLERLSNIEANLCAAHPSHIKSRHSLSRRLLPIQNWAMPQQGLTFSLLFTASTLAFTVIIQSSPWLDEMSASQKKFDNEVERA